MSRGRRLVRLATSGAEREAEREEMAERRMEAERGQKDAPAGPKRCAKMIA